MITAIIQRLQDLPPSVLYRHVECYQGGTATHRILGSIAGTLYQIGYASCQLDAYRVKREAKSLFVYDEVIVQKLVCHLCSKGLTCKFC